MRIKRAIVNAHIWLMYKLLVIIAGVINGTVVVVIKVAMRIVSRRRKQDC